jgi:CheY-like chemotaxis protein
MKRVLIVDDEPSFTRLLKLNLEQTGRYEVLEVNWPEDAYAAAQKFKPDVIFLDVMMPRMFGGDVAAQLQAHPALKPIPIVFLTAAVPKHRIEDHDQGVISGFPFLPKPVSVSQILEWLEQHLPK